MRVFKVKTLVRQDIKNAYPKHRFFTLLAQAKKKTGLHPFQILKDWLPLKLSNRSLKFKEYLLFGLFNPKFTKKDKRRFVSDENKYWVNVFEIIETPKEAFESKIIMHEIMQHADLPIPKTHGIIFKKPHRSIAKQIIKNPKDLKSFLQKHTGNLLFGKPNLGIQSIGTFRIQDHDETHLTLANIGRISHAEFFKRIIGTDSFLLQETIKNHSDLKTLSNNLCTIRTYNILRHEQILTPFALLKIPMGQNIADNFWREGNLIAAINTQTGIIESVKQKDGIFLKDILEHPVTKVPLIGFQIPNWQDILDINQKAADAFADLRYQAFDIAITPNGPVIIEINHNGSFLVPQAATGKGFLTDEVLAFVNRRL